MSENLNLKISSSPHVRSKTSTSDVMFDVLIALTPAAAFGLYQFGWHSALLMLVCIACCVGFEALFQKIVKKKITVLDFSAAVTGLLLAMNLPPELPVWMAVIGSFFAIIVVKQLFGGLGQNFMNPALAARCFMLLSFSKQMTTFTYDGVTAATPLTILKAGGDVNIKDMFFGFTGGTIGETSAIALLIGAVYLLIKKVISPKIPLIYIGTFAACIAIYATVKDYNVAQYTLAHLFGGGLMLGAWFMATDYVTSPITSLGKIIYAVILGLLTFVLRIFGSGAEGVSYAIIISNILVPLIEKFTVPAAFGEGAEIKDKKAHRQELKEEKKAQKEASTDNEVKEKDKFDFKGIMKAIVAICIITLVMGAALGVVYNVTKDPIEKANEKAKTEAYKEVFPDAYEVRNPELDLTEINDVIKEMGYTHDTIDELNIAIDENKNLIGYVFVVTDDNGYGGEIQMVIGFRNDGTVTGISFLSINETVGLGMEATSEEFKKQFVGKSSTGITYTKQGAVLENQVDALSGATITTSAVCDGVNAAMSIMEALKGGATGE